MEGRFIFGVCRTPFESNNSWHVRVRALRFLGGPECKLSDFPDEEGDVFWPLGSEPPSWVKEGALCTLETARSHRYGTPGFSWYRPAPGSVAPVQSELIDISSQVHSEDAFLHRRDFYVGWPVPRRIYVRIGDYVYGPFEAEQRKRRVALVDSNQEHIYYRHNWSDVEGKLAFRVDTPGGHTRWVLEDEDALAKLDRKPRDGRTTVQLVNWYLRGLRDSDNVPEQVRHQITRKSLRGTAQASDIFFGDPDLVEHQIERLHGLGQAFHRMTQKDPSIIEIAMGQDTFHEAVARRIEQTVSEQKNIIEQQLQPLRAELEHLTTTKHELTEELEALRRRLREEAEQFDQVTKAKTEQMAEQQQHLSEERERLLRDFWVLSGLLDGESPLRANAAVSSADEAAPGTETSAATKNQQMTEPAWEIATKPQQLTSQLFHALGGDAQRLSAFEPLHTALREHRLFALPDDSHLPWFARYAAALGPGTRTHHVIVEPGWTGCQCLFGRVNARTRQFEPAPGGAMDFWIEAIGLDKSDATGMQFLLLHDANRSPMEVWMAKLLAAASAPESFPITLFDQRQVIKNDAFFHYATLPWPDNLRVVCILAADDFSYEPTDALKRRFPIVAVAPDEPLPPVVNQRDYKTVSAHHVRKWDWTTIAEELT